MNLQFRPKTVHFFGFFFGLLAAICTGLALGGFYWPNMFQPYAGLLLLGAILLYQWASYFRAVERHHKVISTCCTPA